MFFYGKKAVYIYRKHRFERFSFTFKTFNKIDKSGFNCDKSVKKF